MQPPGQSNGYTPAVRRVEWASIVAYFVLLGWLGVRLLPSAGLQLWWVLAAVLLAYLGADLVSGFVHWAADTWGSPDVPLLGKALLRPFREHHVDPMAMTRHDFVETNGNNCLISVPALAVAHWLVPQTRQGSPFWASFGGALVLWVLMTNQFHKWAHLQSPPVWIAWLQRLHLILPPAHHVVHHTRPYNRFYNITVGWLNPPLSWIRVYPALEWLVTAVTGVLPRRDDLGVRDAEALFAEQHERAAGSDLRLPHDA